MLFHLQISDRSLTTIDYDHVGSETNNLFKGEDHLSTAFNLAALMQNGFPPPGAILNPHSLQQFAPKPLGASSSVPVTGTSTATGQPATGLSTNAAATDIEQKWQPPTGNEDCLPWAANKNTAFAAQQKMFK